MTRLCGNSTANASSTPNTPPEAPTVGADALIERRGHHHQLHQAGREHGSEVQPGEPARTQRALDHAAERVQRVHVERDVREDRRAGTRR